MSLDWQIPFSLIETDVEKEEKGSQVNVRFDF